VLARRVCERVGAQFHQWDRRGRKGWGWGCQELVPFTP